MTFVWPYLLGALALPLVAALRRRRSAARTDRHPQVSIAQAAGAIVRPAPAAPPGRGRGWAIAGLSLTIVALARPQWGRVEENETETGREILIALDLSRSMLTPDVPPSRLDRAKLLTQSLLDQLSGERVGLMVFAGSPFLQAPLSSDYEVLREFLPQMTPDFLPDAGTNFGALLAAAPGAFTADGAADRFLILLSDGGANDTAWSDELERLKQRGIRIIALGVGTAAGGFIPDGAGGFLKDERGAVVLARLEDTVLRRLADATGGVYRDASSWVDVAAVVRSTVAAGREARFATHRSGRAIERYQWPLAAALLCLLASLWHEFPLRPRPRVLRWAGAVLLPFVLLRGAEAPAQSAPAPGELLNRLVDRLANSGRTASALDWAELAQDTVTWGREFAESGQAVPGGPVRDALAGVDAGRRADPSAADWPKLSAELGALLKEPPPQKKPPPPPKPQPKNEDQPKDDKASPEQPPPPGGSTAPSSAPPENGGFSPPPAPPPSAEEAQDPSLTVPLQQLERVKQGDSPAQLFQMLQRQNPPPKAPPKTAKPW